MRIAHLWRPLLGVAGALALAGCVDDGYYGGVGGGYGYGYYGEGYYGDGYYDGYGPGYGWYDGYYYPGGGVFVYDRDGHRHDWRDRDRDHWQHHGDGNWIGNHGNWNGNGGGNWQNHAGNGQGRSGNWQGHSGNWQNHGSGQGGQMNAPRMQSSPHFNGGGGGGGFSGWHSHHGQ
jgi:hypothetical protein